VYVYAGGYDALQGGGGGFRRTYLLDAFLSGEAGFDVKGVEASVSGVLAAQRCSKIGQCAA
jgi:hypothetical protein